MTFYFPIPEKVTKSNIVYDCNRCKLFENKKLTNPKFPDVIGENYNGLVIVCDNPSKEDDQKGIPLVNEKATFVRSSSFRKKINLAKEAAFVYASRCSKNKKSDTQYKCCRGLLAKSLKELKPKLIITLGDMAFKSVMGLKNKIGPTLIRNRIVPNYEFNCLVYTCLNPNDIYTYDMRFAFQKDL